MAIYTSEYLRTISRKGTLNESIKNFSAKDKTRSTFDIFLSHSFLDKEEVEGLYLELSNTGFSVYVDWIIDPHLDRSNVTKESANLVRTRMQSSRSLLLGISENAAVSKWMPWELGYVDGHTKACAIIPVTKKQTSPNSYRAVEYLSLYPFISKKSDNQGKDRLWVIEEADSYIVIEDWIIGKKPFKRNVKIF